MDRMEFNFLKTTYMHEGYGYQNYNYGCLRKIYNNTT